MPIMKSSTALTALLLAATSIPTIANAQSTGLEDMVGARAGQAEAELQRRGYVNTGGQQGDDRDDGRTLQFDPADHGTRLSAVG